MYSDFGSKPLTETVLITLFIVCMVFVKLDEGTRVALKVILRVLWYWKHPKLRESTWSHNTTHYATWLW